MMFYLSKIFWLIINPFNIILFLTFCGIVAHHLFPESITYKVIYFLLLMFFIISAVMPTGNFMVFQLEKNFHLQPIIPNQVDGILILAGATNPILSKEYNKINLNGSVERLTEAILLIRKYPRAKIIFSGGSGSIKNQKFTHAKVAKDFFEQFQIDTRKIIFESKSRNTYENILYSKEIANPTYNENWLLITSASHMTRSMNIAKKLDWKFIPYSVDFSMQKKFSWKPSINFLGNIGSFQGASHEWTGLIAYYFLGRTSQIY